MLTRGSVADKLAFTFTKNMSLFESLSYLVFPWAEVTGKKNRFSSELGLRISAYTPERIILLPLCFFTTLELQYVRLFAVDPMYLLENQSVNNVLN